MNKDLKTSVNVAMETCTIQKNGASPKSHTIRGNFISIIMKRVNPFLVGFIKNIDEIFNLCPQKRMQTLNSK
jgi:hypothetical protein